MSRTADRQLKVLARCDAATKKVEAEREDVRSYLAEKALDPREWLRRSPRTTHPTILVSVRTFRDAGGFYDDEALAYVSRNLDVPESLHKQLGHEIYLAKGMLKDEGSANEERDMLNSGWHRTDAAKLVDGGRYLYRHGTVYVGQDVPVYGDEVEVRAKASGDRIFLLRKGARTRGFLPGTSSLVKPISKDAAAMLEP